MINQEFIEENNFYNELINVLKNDERFISEDGQLLRNSVYEAAMKMDSSLVKSLLNNEETKKRFFTDIDGIAVFDKVGFGWVINNREFLPDSYTRYKNKIGLVNNKGEYISASNDVELVFPYKDCVLEGGQTKEDQKRSEIFYNETLAPDEIDRLLYPKALTNAKRYTVNGVQDITDISENDNLVIKGNNLLGLASIEKRYSGMVKCVFIDPPYYFLATKPSDTFSYNSNFKLSSWLVFLKNRLTITHRLLANNGILYMTISDEGAHYLKVLTDDIFGMENFIADITWESRKSISSDGLISENNNHILVYAKNKKSIDKNSFRLALDIESFIYDDNDGRGKYRLEPFDAPAVRENLQYVIKNPNTGEEYLPPAGRHWRTEEKTYRKFLEDNRIRFGANGTARPQFKAYYEEVKKAGKGKASSTIWHDVNQSIIWQEVDTNTNATKDQLELFGESIFTNPKPEDLVKRAIELATSENDIVLDFFMGSATTQAVALKMNRRFIGFEQMDYIHTVSIPRLQKVIEGEQTGISKEVNWQGGGSFIYCELAKLNQNYVDSIEKASTDEELARLYNDILKTGFISYKVNPKEIDTNSDEFIQLSIDDKKRLLMEMLDKNQLYVNYCDIDDETFNISEEDKAFTRNFYKEV
ncbi:site-specific DNA-methyltransferase [Faecalitalea cylindroides]|uniref:DNA methyltransferase n=1 Tax=Faecalitalea cylindroides TaxID=39483 RepID=UPI00195EF81D|nr:site-specific DNA-methyltransferase [Faecalitalea cylindroides]MBM6810630.1 site-specific DNA-methyltransferase [Faecalitalea cylindroides]